jgi:pimeloyl-ACP methyl ester carboxylesterase
VGPTCASTVDDVNYVVTGSGDETIVLLHGFSDNLVTWNRVVPRLAVDHCVIAIDLPGFGASSRCWTTPLLDCYVDVINDVLAAEGVESPVALMGNSMGAVVSTIFAARHPEQVDRAVLIDMPGLRSVPRLWTLAMSRPAEIALRTALQVVPEGVARLGLGWAYQHIAAAHPDRLDPLTRDGFLRPYVKHDSIPALLPLGRALLSELRTAGLAALVGELSVPVLLVFGARDLLTPARVVRRLGRPGGAVVLPGCGHCPQVDQPGALLSQVVPFLHDEQGNERELVSQIA